MKAGRELDFKVATEVMGWEPRYVERGRLLGPYLTSGPLDQLYCYNVPGGPHRPCGWSPSTEIAAAWEVVEKVVERTRFRVQVGCGLNFAGNFSWYAFFGDPADSGSGQCETAPLAISLAALKAVSL
jgi:hypothetical protein